MIAAVRVATRTAAARHWATGPYGTRLPGRFTALGY